MTTKIFIVDDHPLFQQTLREVIARMPDFEVCGAATTAEHALQRVSDAGPDLVLIDISLPSMNGIELVRSLRSLYPGLHCVFLSGYAETIFVQQGLATGARGFILKGKPQELASALRQIVAGELYLSEGVRTA